MSWIHRRPGLAEVGEESRSRVVIISSGAEVFSSDNRWSVQVSSGGQVVTWSGIRWSVQVEFEMQCSVFSF